MVSLAWVNQVRSEGGCVYGGGTAGQKGFPHLCRAAVAPGTEYCPRHGMELAAAAAKPSRKGVANVERLGRTA